MLLDEHHVGYQETGLGLKSFSQGLLCSRQGPNLRRCIFHSVCLKLNSNKIINEIQRFRNNRFTHYKRLLYINTIKFIGWRMVMNLIVVVILITRLIKSADVKLTSVFLFLNVICTISVLTTGKTENDNNQHWLRIKFRHFDYEKI